MDSLLASRLGAPNSSNAAICGHCASTSQLALTANCGRFASRSIAVVRSRNRPTVVDPA